MNNICFQVQGEIFSCNKKCIAESNTLLALLCNPLYTFPQDLFGNFVIEHVKPENFSLILYYLEHPETWKNKLEALANFQELMDAATKLHIKPMITYLQQHFEKCQIESVLPELMMDLFQDQESLEWKKQTGEHVTFLVGGKPFVISIDRLCHFKSIVLVRAKYL